MQNYINYSTILTQAKMLWDDYKKPTVYVEGNSDKLFLKTSFKKYENISFCALDGWENVYKIISLAEEKGFINVLGIIDKDYHNINNDGVIQNQQLYFTDDNDIEMMLFNSNSLNKFLEVCGSEKKLKTVDNPRELVLKAAFPIGILRSISLLNQYCLWFEDFDYKSVIDKNNLTIDVDKLVSKIIDRTRCKGKTVTETKENIVNQISAILESGNNKDYCNGHDVFAILCIAMTKLFATASANDYTENVVFNYLLVGYSAAEFEKTSLYAKISNWIESKVL